MRLDTGYREGQGERRIMRQDEIYSIYRKYSPILLDTGTCLTTMKFT